MDVRGIRTSLQDDAEEGYILDGREISNFGEFYELSFVRAKTSLARVQLILKNKSTMKGAVVRLLVVFSGKV